VKKKTSQNKSEQLNLDLKKRNISNLRDKFLFVIKSWLSYFEVIKYTRDPLIWIPAVFYLWNTFFQFYIIQESINQLPNLIPLLPFANNLESKLVDKGLLIYIPVTLITLFMVTMYISFKNYHHERKVCYFMLFSSSFSSFMISLGIYKLILIYT